MSFEKVVRLNEERIGPLLGKKGVVKSDIESRCGVEISVDGETGDVTIRSTKLTVEMTPFKAVEIVTAIARGFSPRRAFRLLEEDMLLNIIDLRDYHGKSPSTLIRIRGRLIGLAGKSRRLIEELSGADISVYGHTAGIIGTQEEAKLASEAISKLAAGTSHRSVYNMLQKARTRAKMERMILWEGQKLGP